MCAPRTYSQLKLDSLHLYIWYSKYFIVCVLNLINQFHVLFLCSFIVSSIKELWHPGGIIKYYKLGCLNMIDGVILRIKKDISRAVSEHFGALCQTSIVAPEGIDLFTAIVFI